MAAGRRPVSATSSAIAFDLVAGVLLLLFATAMGSSEFVRPPPRRIVTTPHAKSDSHPQQVHISAVGSDHMRVTYITEDKHVPSMVEYGRSPGKYDSSAAGESTSYSYFFYTSGKIHHVKIGPLEPGTVYYYRCGGVGDEFSFKTPPATLPIELAIIDEDLRQRCRPVRPRLHHRRRRRQPGRSSLEFRQEPRVGEAVGVPGGELRARAAEGGERDARALVVAPQRRRRLHRRGPGLAAEPERVAGVQAAA